MTTAPVFVVAPGALGTAERPVTDVVLDGPEGHHAAQVRRIRAGERADLVDGSGVRAQCHVTDVDRGVVRLRVASTTDEPTPRLRVVVVQAIAKGDRGERAVELLTEVGVDEVVPWAAARSVVEWRGERGEKALQRWRSTARESSKQSRRARFTEVSAMATTADVAIRLRAATLALVLSGDAPTPLPAIGVPADGEVVMVVGPEGDLTAAELTTFDTAGARRVSLGSTVMRTSTAGVVGATLVLARTRWLDRSP